MSKNWRLKNFRIDPALDEKFTMKCGPFAQQDILNELIKMFVNDKITVVVDGIVVKKEQEEPHVKESTKQA